MARKRTSKYLNKEFDNGWKCTYVGVAKVQPKRKLDHTFSKNPGRQSYYYVFERITSDGKAEKLIRVEKNMAAKIYSGKVKVEDLVENREINKEKHFTKKVSYHFIDR